MCILDCTMFVCVCVRYALYNNQLWKQLSNCPLYGSFSIVLNIFKMGGVWHMERQQRAVTPF